MSDRVDAGTPPRSSPPAWLRPRRLRPGDRVAVIAPASPFDRARFDRGLDELRALGFDPVVDDAVFARETYLAGSAALRARQIRSAWEDPAVAGLIAARGGYGSAQLLPLLDPATFRRRPKVFVGSSDVTSLLTTLTLASGVVGFHGPMVVTLGGGRSHYDRSTLMEQVMCHRAYGELAVEPPVVVLKRGRARGPLLGGTLTQIAASLGTPFAFTPPSGYVLLLDEIGERPYRIDRMLTQLGQAGVLARACAVICAEFPCCDEPGGQVTARSVLDARLAEVDGPVVFGLPTGHATRPVVTLPLGVEVTVDAGDTGRIVVEEAAVA